MGTKSGYSTGEGLIDCCEWPEVMSASEIIEVIDRFHFSMYIWSNHYVLESSINTNHMQHLSILATTEIKSRFMILLTTW